METGSLTSAYVDFNFFHFLNILFLSTLWTSFGHSARRYYYLVLKILRFVSESCPHYHLSKSFIFLKMNFTIHCFWIRSSSQISKLIKSVAFWLLWQLMCTFKPSKFQVRRVFFLITNWKNLLWLQRRHLAKRSWSWFFFIVFRCIF